MKKLIEFLKHPILRILYWCINGELLYSKFVTVEKCLTIGGKNKYIVLMDEDKHNEYREFVKNKALDEFKKREL
jgi:hypothetical protein